MKVGTFCSPVASGPSCAISKNGFLLFRPAEDGTGLVGKPAAVGVFEVEAFLARNGFVSEFDDSDFGSVSVAGMGFGSSKGDSRAASESVMRVDMTREKVRVQFEGGYGRICTVFQKGGRESGRRGGRDVTFVAYSGHGRCLGR
jgi:hypothetical protein